MKEGIKELPQVGLEPVTKHADVLYILPLQFS